MLLDLQHGAEDFWAKGALYPPTVPFAMQLAVVVEINDVGEHFGTIRALETSLGRLHLMVDIEVVL